MENVIQLIDGNYLKMTKLNILIVITLILIMPVSHAKEINISDLPLDEKIHQMIIIPAENYYDKDVGGIFFGTGKKLDSSKEYEGEIKILQDKSKIKMFVAADLEGYWNPFDKFYTGKAFGDIANESEAYILGEEHGRILESMGFNLDFSPVAETRNTVWPGRSFSGSTNEVELKVKAYIEGLHKKGILATAKHYPGGSMVKNPHYRKYKTEIFDEDIALFDHAINSSVDAIMIGHPVAYGAVDSNSKPSSVSEEVIFPLRERFDGLIISDAITMIGLRVQYLGRFDKIYIDLIKAGNDLILDLPLRIFPFSSNGRKIEKRVQNVIRAVERGEITEKRIDESVIRILRAKGYEVLI